MQCDQEHPYLYSKMHKDTADAAHAIVDPRTHPPPIDADFGRILLPFHRKCGGMSESGYRSLCHLPRAYVIAYAVCKMCVPHVDVIVYI